MGKRSKYIKYKYVSVNICVKIRVKLSVLVKQN